MSVTARALAAAALLMAALGLFHAWSLFVDPLEVRFGVSRAAVSAVYAAATAVFTLSMLGAHVLVRRYPPAFVAAGAGFAAAGGLALAGSGSLAALWLGYAGLFGIANGIGYAVALQVAQVALPHRLGLATSLAVTAYALGPAAFAPLLERGVDRLGVLDTFLATAAVTAGVGALQLVLLRGAGRAEPPGRARATARDRTFWLLWLGFLLGSLAGLAVLAHAAPLVRAAGGSAAAAAAGVALIAAGNAAGRLAGGWLTDALPVRAVLVAAGLACAPALVLAAAVSSPATALLAVALVGVGYGTIASAYPAAVGRFYGPAATSLVYGRLFTAWGVAGVIAPVAAGAAFDRTGGYGVVLAAAAGAALASIAVALRLPRAPTPPVPASPR